jgi:hypothetical protein
MVRSRTARLLSFCAALAITASAAAESLPADRVVTYSIHARPGDATTELLWTIDLSLTAVIRIGNSVAWRITRVEITDVAGDRYWIDTPPLGILPDWWIIHADPLSPSDSEFAVTPHLDRAAVSQTAGVGNLRYDIRGGASPGSFIAPHYWWDLRLAGGDSAESEGVDQPVVIDARLEG